ncbi:MAG: ABC transporter permease [Tannerella sp.]|jgi:ABC-2 type transport system permease protein|nr:ABC transporter permease [Tannerella sp.]
MKKIGIVTKREYLRRVNKKSFIFLTLFAPVLFAALVFVPLWLSSIKSGDIYEVAIADRTGKYVSLFKDTDKFHFVSANDPGSLDKSRENSSGIFAFLEITDDLLINQKAVTLYSEKQIPADLTREVNHTLSQYLENEKRASFNIPNLDEIIKNSRVHIDVQTIKWGKDGTATESSSAITSGIGMFFTLIIYMFIMMYGAVVMQGVMEEKTNRIVEVMVSSVRPFDLMMGKIIGIGLVGLTQVFVWCVLTGVLVSVGGIFWGMSSGQDTAAMQMGLQPGMSDIPEVTSLLSKLHSFNFVEIIIYFVLFFIGGYISYASLFAAIGSAVDNPEDSQQFMTPMMIFLMFAVYAGIYSVQNPDGPLAFWCSLIPFTSPVVMMVRVPHEIPFWQILVSLVLLFASAIFFVWLSAKIYRVGILMYGKKPSIKEIVRWVKY